jgi:hypothetical protein
MYIFSGKVWLSMSHGNLHLKKPQQNSRTQSKPKMSARKYTGAEASPKEQGKPVKFSSNNSDVSAESIGTFVRWTHKF